MANVPTTSWDETSPSGSSNISLGDNRIRELKTQLREIITVDHEMSSSGQSATWGYHNQVTLVGTSDIGSGASNYPILGSQQFQGKPELTYTDEDDTDVVITSNGELYGGSSPSVTNWIGLLKLVYPVGAVVTLGVSTNPTTLFGFGTWAAIEGKVIVGIAGSGTFDTLDATGGAETVTLTAAQSGVPAHTHTVNSRTDSSAAGTDDLVVEGQASANSTVPLNANSGAAASEAHTNLQPYIVKYVWQRTA